MAETSADGDEKVSVLIPQSSVEEVAAPIGARSLGNPFQGWFASILDEVYEIIHAIAAEIPPRSHQVQQLAAPIPTLAEEIQE